MNQKEIRPVKLVIFGSHIWELDLLLIKSNMTPRALFAKRSLKEAVQDGSLFTHSLNTSDVFGLSLKAFLLHFLLEVPFEACLQLPKRIMIQLVHRHQNQTTNTGKPRLTHGGKLGSKDKQRFNTEWGFLFCNYKCAKLQGRPKCFGSNGFTICSIREI